MSPSNGKPSQQLYMDIPTVYNEDTDVNDDPNPNNNSHHNDVIEENDPIMGQMHILNGGGNHHRDDTDLYRSHQNPYKSPSLRGDGYGGGGTTNSHNPLRNRFRYHQQQQQHPIYHNNNNNTNLVNTIQSHNYEPDESEVWRAWIAQVHFKNRGQWWTSSKQRTVKRWVLTFCIGVLQAVIATLCNFGTRSLSHYKFQHVYALLRPPSTSSMDG